MTRTAAPSQADRPRFHAILTIALYQRGATVSISGLTGRPRGGNVGSGERGAGGRAMSEADAAETILIVDDEEPVRRTFREWLEGAELGCRVLSAGDAA